ncbi:MAG: hypothetical protein MK035_03365, partial [Dehalococcoidia bacterium]|nr:hypothetical protein [Dehalococcoidia bacterium]
ASRRSSGERNAQPTAARPHPVQRADSGALWNRAFGNSANANAGANANANAGSNTNTNTDTYACPACGSDTYSCPNSFW